MRIAAYCRVSTGKEEQLDSLENQKEFFEEYAKKNRFELVHLYADEGISGKALKKRDEFKRMLHDADEHLFDMIVVKDISRFARNTVDSLTAIRHLKTLGIEVTFISNSMTILGQSEFVITVFSALAQEESANLSKRVKFGKRVTGKKGRTPTIIYGYEHVDNLHLAINEEEADTVRFIYRQYVAERCGCRRIAAELNKKGVKTKRGAEWNSRGIRRILENPIYCGEYVNHKYEVGDFLEGKLVKTAPGEQMRHDRPEWAIVSKTLFEKAQQQIAERRSRCKDGYPRIAERYSSRHVFSNLIKCAQCGRSFSRRTYTYLNTRVYWQCPTHNECMARQCDNNVTVTERDLLAELREYLAGRIGNETEFINSVLEAYEEEARSKPAEERDFLRRRLTKLRRQKEKIQQMYTNDIIDLTALRDQGLPLNAEIQDLTKRLSASDPQEKSPAADWERRMGFEKEVRRFLNLETVTNADMRRIVDKIVVDHNRTVEIVLKKYDRSAFLFGGNCGGGGPHCFGRQDR